FSLSFQATILGAPCGCCYFRCLPSLLLLVWPLACYGSLPMPVSSDFPVPGGVLSWVWLLSLARIQTSASFFFSFFFFLFFFRITDRLRNNCAAISDMCCILLMCFQSSPTTRPTMTFACRR